MRKTSSTLFVALITLSSIVIASVLSSLLNMLAVSHLLTESTRFFIMLIAGLLCSLVAIKIMDCYK